VRKIRLSIFIGQIVAKAEREVKEERRLRR
jgi:hypothetical protein